MLISIPISIDATSASFTRSEAPKMAWRLARSLETLRNQVNRAFPNRNKVSDGTIGDAAHASRTSDHNPWYGPGIVTAIDLTHDPARGMDCHKLADALVRNRDRRVKYIIWNGRIWNPYGGWRGYYGSNPHNKHLHLSVVASADCDNVTPWNLVPLVSPIPPPATGGLPTLRLTNPPTKHEAAGKVQRVLNAWYPNAPWGNGALTVDSIYGEHTVRAVKHFQKASGLADDGIVGPATYAALSIR